MMNCVVSSKEFARLHQFQLLKMCSFLVSFYRAAISIRSYVQSPNDDRSDFLARPERFVFVANGEYFSWQRNGNESSSIANLLGTVAHFFAQICHRTNPFDDTNYHRSWILSMLDSAIVERLLAFVILFEYAKEFTGFGTILSAHRIFT